MQFSTRAMPRRFRDRSEAGQILADSLAHYADRDDVIVLALPRGGVPVAFEVARALRAPLDVLVVRKLGVPGHEEFAMGAIASGGIRFVDRDVVGNLGLSQQAVESVVALETDELRRREMHYRVGKPFPDLRGKAVILIDDGLATGSTMRAAALAIRQQQPAHLTIAVPVAPEETCAVMREVADEVVCAHTPEPFYAVGFWYQHFGQTTDEEVRDLLQRAGRGGDSTEHVEEREVSIRDGRADLGGTLSFPRNARGLVIFAHGSGSSRHSPRNQHVARRLQQAGFATLLMDLLSSDEESVDEHTREYRFDIGLLARRLVIACEWLEQFPEANRLPFGLFGASTGAAAALVAAAARPGLVEAVVSRGGRPDLAGQSLRRVRAPTLLIVGEADEVVLELNQSAAGEMTAPVRLAIVPGATHLFEEPGAMNRVAQLARDWFVQQLASTPLDSSSTADQSRRTDFNR